LKSCRETVTPAPAVCLAPRDKREAGFGPPLALRLDEVPITEPRGSTHARKSSRDQSHRHRECRGTLQENNPAADLRPSRLALAPNRVNASLATSKIHPRFRRASVRAAYVVRVCERFFAIGKNICNRRQSPILYLFGDTLRFICSDWDSLTPEYKRRAQFNRWRLAPSKRRAWRCSMTMAPQDSRFQRMVQIPGRL
jgi:hypothetical protein